MNESMVKLDSKYWEEYEAVINIMDSIPMEIEDLSVYDEKAKRFEDFNQAYDWLKKQRISIPKITYGRILRWYGTICGEDDLGDDYDYENADGYESDYFVPNGDKIIDQNILNGLLNKIKNDTHKFIGIVWIDKNLKGRKTFNLEKLVASVFGSHAHEELPQDLKPIIKQFKTLLAARLWCGRKIKYQKDATGAADVFETSGVENKRVWQSGEFYSKDY